MMDQRLNAAYAHVIAFSPKLSPDLGVVPYCAVDPGGRRMSPEEWTLRSASVKDDFNLCFFGTEDHSWSEWKRLLDFRFTPRTLSVRDTGANIKLYGFFIKYEPILAHKFGAAPEPPVEAKRPKREETVADLEFQRVVRMFKMLSYVNVDAADKSAVAIGKAMAKVIADVNVELGAAHEDATAPNATDAMRQACERLQVKYTNLKSLFSAFQSVFKTLDAEEKALAEAEKRRLIEMQRARDEYAIRRAAYDAAVKDKLDLDESIKLAVWARMRTVGPATAVVSPPAPPTKRRRKNKKGGGATGALSDSDGSGDEEAPQTKAPAPVPKAAEVKAPAPVPKAPEAKVPAAAIAPTAAAEAKAPQADDDDDDDAAYMPFG